MIGSYLRTLSILLAVAAIALGACAPEPASGVETMAPPNTPVGEPSLQDLEAGYYAGDPEAGLLVFNDHCLECHSTRHDAVFGGPSLQQAGERLELDYVVSSIVDPREFVAVDFQGTVGMIDNFSELLSAEELRDVVAYIMAQH